HFNLEEDAENWRYFKEVGSSLKLKADVVPRQILSTPQKIPRMRSQLSSSSKKRKKDFNLSLGLSTSLPSTMDSATVSLHQPSCSAVSKSPIPLSSPPTEETMETEVLIFRNSDSMTMMGLINPLPWQNHCQYPPYQHHPSSNQIQLWGQQIASVRFTEINTMKMMPIQFRRSFLNVGSIIDGFEIEIEKPAKPSLQSLTWSEYKHYNTMKYLISSTPLGLINFVSSGFGGRISDSKLMDRSGYLNLLPRGCMVLADRGFKQIEGLLAQKDVKLVRPPSVSRNQQLSKKDARDNQRISSNRVHIKIVISRAREFRYLAPHACVDNHLICLLDDAVIVACAIINLQDPIIGNV
ncbi:hypothetical protein GE061_008903, partial [Apolygus lucorum]